jgi:hypothetical protein
MYVTLLRDLFYFTPETAIQNVYAMDHLNPKRFPFANMKRRKSED